MLLLVRPESQGHPGAKLRKRGAGERKAAQGCCRHPLPAACLFSTEVGPHSALPDTTHSPIIPYLPYLLIVAWV